jgi:hypothetical protein
VITTDKADLLFDILGVIYALTGTSTRQAEHNILYTFLAVMVEVGNNIT